MPERTPIPKRTLNLLRTHCHEFRERAAPESACRMLDTGGQWCRCERQRDSLVNAGLLKADDDA